MTRIANSAKFDVKVVKLLNHIHLGGQLRVDLVQVEDGVALPACLLPHHRQHQPHLVGQAIIWKRKKLWRKHPDVQLDTYAYLDPAVVADGCLHIS